MNNIPKYNEIFIVLSTLSIRLDKKDVKKVFDLTEKEYEELVRLGEEIKCVKCDVDKKLSFCYKPDKRDSVPYTPMEMYVEAIYYMIKTEKLDWSMLEIDRLSQEFENLSWLSDDVLTITNAVGKKFEDEKQFEQAVKLYTVSSYYCEKNNLKKDIFVDCVLHLSRVHFMRGITEYETVKIQEKALSFVTESNCSYKDGLLMVYTGVNQSNVYRDSDGAAMRQKGVEILSAFDNYETEDAVYIKAWHYNWSGEIAKITALYESVILSIDHDQIKTTSPFLYLPIIFAYFYLGEYSRALVIAENLYKDALKKEDEQAAVMMLSVIGRCHVYLNNLDKAESVLYDTLNMATQINYTWATYYTLIALSFLHLKRNNPKGCINIMEKAYEVSQKENVGNIQNSPFIMDVFQLISNSGIETSLPSYDERVDFFLKSNNSLMKGVALRHDANRRALRDEKPEDVIQTYKESIDFLMKTGSTVEIGTSQAMLAKYLIKINNTSAAQKYAQYAYENLHAKTPELIPVEVLGLINTGQQYMNIRIKMNTLMLELNHIVEEKRLITRMMTSLERLLFAECGMLVTYQNEVPNIAFRENFKEKDGNHAEDAELLGVCAFTRELQKIYTRNRLQKNRFASVDSKLLLIERSPSFFVAIPIVIDGRCDAVIYIESYLRCEELSYDEKQALTVFANSIAEHFFAVLDYKKERFSVAEKESTAIGEIPSSYCKSSNTVVNDVEKMIRKVSMTDVPVLIYGETGVGKEYFAKETFANSKHKNIFIKVNCGAIPESLIESELFGYEKGSFTGASQRKIGYFEAAEGGTVFLDEIGELSLYAQTKLLRVLQEKTLMRVGGTVEIKVNFRLIAATNKDLEKEVEKGNFRQDLFYRLNLIQLNVPPLRERKEDIINFAKFFIKKYERQLGQGGHYLSEKTLLWMLEYNWPGNIRELENVIHRAVLLAEDKEINIDPIKQKQGKTVCMSKMDTLDEMERKYILQVLDMCNGKISGPSGATEILGLKRTTLTSKMEKLGIVKKNN